MMAKMDAWWEEWLRKKVPKMDGNDNNNDDDEDDDDDDEYDDDHHDDDDEEEPILLRDVHIFLIVRSCTKLLFCTG
jgi:hypothetical protein